MAKTKQQVSLTPELKKIWTERNRKESGRQKRRILIAASEAVPFVKTGGLADVSGGLPKILKSLGHDVRLVLPRYWRIDRENNNMTRRLSPFGVPMGDGMVWGEIRETELDGFPVYFIEHEGFFGRAGIYDDGYREYGDNAARFGYFSKACLQLCRDLDFRPDIIHCHDWPTAMIPGYIKFWECRDDFFSGTASVFTIHNIGYQGVFPEAYNTFLGLDHGQYTQDKYESVNRINMMKGAIYYADAINTVSPTYAREILSEPGGCGLSAYLERRRSDVYGILNGVDYEYWNPEQDELIPEYFSRDDLSGKAICKQILQKEFNLEVNPGIALVGLVSRFADQKGLDLLVPVIESIVQNMRVQFVILGAGEKWMEDFYGGLPARCGGRIGAWIGYENRKAHLIEAGSDFFLMPSRYEPCGLNQIFSLKYGTLPIVRATGGLVDTVEQYNEATGEGTGFRFDDVSPLAVYYAVGWAVSTYYDRPAHIEKMRFAGMEKSFCWQDTARAYEKLYAAALGRRAAWR